MLRPAVNLGFGLPKEGAVGIRDLPVMIDIGIFEAARSRTVLFGRLVDIVITLEKTYDLVPIEGTNRMPRLQTGLPGSHRCKQVCRFHPEAGS